MFKSYYEIRMSELGVNDENNFIHLSDPEADFPRNPTVTKPIFSEDSEGNIQILYYTLDRELITYIQKGVGKTGNINAKDRHYFQTRLKSPSGDKKYILPKGQPTYPFLPIPIVEQWERKEIIETLIITEGHSKLSLVLVWVYSLLDCLQLRAIRTRKQDVYIEILSALFKIAK